MINNAATMNILMIASANVISFRSIILLGVYLGLIRGGVEWRVKGQCPCHIDWDRHKGMLCRLQATNKCSKHL